MYLTPAKISPLWRILNYLQDWTWVSELHFHRNCLVRNQFQTISEHRPLHGHFFWQCLAWDREWRGWALVGMEGFKRNGKFKWHKNLFKTIGGCLVKHSLSQRQPLHTCSFFSPVRSVSQCFSVSDFFLGSIKRESLWRRISVFDPVFSARMESCQWKGERFASFTKLVLSFHFSCKFSFAFAVTSPALLVICYVQAVEDLARSSQKPWISSFDATFLLNLHCQQPGVPFYGSLLRLNVLLGLCYKPCNMFYSSFRFRCRVKNTSKKFIYTRRFFFVSVLISGTADADRSTLPLFVPNEEICHRCE